MIAKGLVKRVGAGTWTHMNNVSSTKYSLVEIGDDSLRNVVVSEYIGNFVEPGADIEAAIPTVFGTKVILAVKRDGKVHRDWLVRLGLGATFFGLPALIALFTGHILLFLVLGIIAAGFAWPVYSALTLT